MRTITCEECLFWHPTGKGFGDCRRHAPRPSPGEDDAGFYWVNPKTDADYWCGEAVEDADDGDV